MSAQVAALRAALEQRYPGSIPITQRVAPAAQTGITELDRVLPGGGFPRGKLTTWAPATGASAVMHSACRAALGRGERAAWIDATSLCAPTAAWDGIALLRPEDPRDALACAEELLRSGGYAIVVVAGAETAGADRVRISRAAKDGGAAWVELSPAGWMAALRARSEIRPGGFRWRRDTLGEPVALESVGLRVRAAALGWSGHADFDLRLDHREVRMSLDPGLADRRGSPR